MTTAILNDNISASQGLVRQKSDAVGDRRDAPELSGEPSARPTTEQTDIGRAHHRLARESTESSAPVITSAGEAKSRAALIRIMMADSPASALKAHAAVENDAVETAMRRPAV